jgi:EAL domain-containing protein (putative c-di-GMP-specific phosphodiesterase class I)
VAHSHCRAAEALVRGGEIGALQWHGHSLASHFQPIFAVRAGACVGYEALVRALDRDGRPVPAPRLFARAFAEGRGLELDWTCRALHLRSYARIDPSDRTLFINVHSRAAEQDLEAAGEFADLVRFYGLVPRRVCVEILQDPCDDEALLAEAVAALRRSGAAIAMDEFGFGRSNFDRIVALRPDVVKIDRAILVDAVGDDKARRMLPAVIELLHQAGAQVSVEGIESAHEALIAIDSGADRLQGFYFGAPGAGLADEAYGASVLMRLMRMRPGAVAAVGG